MKELKQNISIMDKVNGRQSFLKSLNDFDNLMSNIILEAYNEEHNKNHLKNSDAHQALKDVLKIDYKSYSHIDIKKIKQLTQSDNNCFHSLYTDSNLREIKLFFIALMETHFLLEFVREYDSTKELTQQQQKSTLKKLNSLEYIIDKKSIEKAKIRLNSNINKITERTIFENFLIKFCNSNKDFISKTNIHPTKKATNIVNEIIKDYFNYDITFSKAQRLHTCNTTFFKHDLEISLYFNG